MKKNILFGFTIVIFLAIAIWIYATLTKPTFSPGALQDTNPTTSTGESLVETTEPAPTWNTYPDDRQLLARQYFVYDCNADTFLELSEEASGRIYPASITKLFTAYVAMQYITPHTQIVARDALDLVAWGSSVANIQKGDV